MLNISQPALSQIILHAEDQLGFKLFDRVRGRLIPTEAAQELYPEAERIFSKLGALRRRTVDMRFGRTGLVRVAASAPPAMSIMPKALAAFRKGHPDIVVRSMIAPALNVVDMLRTGEVSMGIAMNDQLHHDIIVETVGHVELVCILPVGHRLSDKENIVFADLQDETLISYRADTLSARLLSSVAEAENLSFAPAIEIDISITALPFVREGIGVAIVDGLLPWDQFPGLICRPFRPQIMIPIAILTSSDRPLSGPNELMRDYLRKVCANLRRGGTGQV